MFSACLELDSLDENVDPNEGKLYVAVMVQGLAQVNSIYLLHHPNTPLLYESGVYYVPERSRRNREFWWRDIKRILRFGYSDCKGLVAWRIAELEIKRGIEALPYVTWSIENGKPVYHVQAITAQGIEDPSERLGMR